MVDQTNFSSIQFIFSFFVYLIYKHVSYPEIISLKKKHLMLKIKNHFTL